MNVLQACAARNAAEAIRGGSRRRRCRQREERGRMRAVVLSGIPAPVYFRDDLGVSLVLRGVALGESHEVTGRRPGQLSPVAHGQMHP
jgi:hypothetical protein